MALQIEHEGPDGVRHEKAYLRIARIEVQRPLDAPDRFVAYWQMWHSNAQRKPGINCVDNGNAEVLSVSIAAAYADLKKTFTKAIDV